MTSNDNTGFCVPYTVRTTPDKGRGVFADAPIREGTILWRHVRGAVCRIQRALAQGALGQPDGCRLLALGSWLNLTPKT